MTAIRFQIGDRVQVKSFGTATNNKVGTVSGPTKSGAYVVLDGHTSSLFFYNSELLVEGERNWPVPMNYIHKGTKLTAKGRDGQVIFATADMDGHSVSTSYGLSQGNTTYLDPQRNYLNVKMDARLESYQAANGPNDSFYERDGWTFLVDYEAHERYQQDLADEKKSKVEREKTDKVRQIQQEIAEAQDKLKNAQAKLDKLGVTL